MTSAFSISQQIIDEVLTSGGNELDSALRIVSYFKKDHMTAANADFLRGEYRTGGKGFIFGGNHVSVWWGESGLHIAVGDTALNSGNATLVTWEQAARRIRELLDMGRYAPQSELDKADGMEIKALADHLWYTHQDLADGSAFSFMDEEIFKGGFPDSTAHIAELLTDPIERQTILDGLGEFAADYAQNNELLRLRFGEAHMRSALTLLEDLRREPLVFTADESVSTPRPGFITQDEVDVVLCRGGIIDQGKFRIYSYFLHDHTAKEKADFLKHEYGDGGFGRTGFDEWHDSKGIAYSRENNHMPYDKVLLPWSKVARRVGELIADGRYMSQRELAHIPEYEKTELARHIVGFYPYQPEDLPRPFPHGTDFGDAVKIVRPQLDEPERVAEILTQMAAILDNTADFDRNYPTMQKAFTDLTAYQNGEYSLFPTDKPAEKEKAGFATPIVPATAPVEQEHPAPAADETAEYDLQLGAAVWLGLDEYEIFSFDDTTVVLRDMKYPLFTREMPRAEFDRKLRENGLNDHLRVQEPKAPGTAEVPPITEEPEPYTPQLGDVYEIQGRRFTVDSVDEDAETVSLRDLTFEGGAGFPIFRSETFDFMRMYEPVKDLPAEKEEPASPHEENLTPAWEQPKPRSRVNQFDPHPEIAMSERHNYRITDDNLGAGGQKTKYRYNVEAIKTLQAIEAENRFATPEEQEVLSKYVGWGGVSQAFDPNHKDWTDEYAELQALLTPEEWRSARDTTVNAHYTSPTVIKAIYKAVENMGFRAGNVLEPSCGIGNFFGLLPDSMTESKLYGVELDSLTGRIARQLYQKNNIAVQGFEKTELPDSFFDFAVGNVPFGEYKVLDKRYDKHNFLIHDYFFARTLDKVRPGGIVAFVTSKGTLDKQNPAVRKYIAQRADLLGAIRLPNTAFKSNANTEVTADIIFLQKRDRIMDIEPDWVHLGETENGVPVNSYFAEHPDMILGEMIFDDRMYGNKSETSCNPFEDSDLAAQLAEAITNIHAEITEYERDEDEPEEDNVIPADPNVRNFSYTVVDGRIYYRQDSIAVSAHRENYGSGRFRSAIPAICQARFGVLPRQSCRGTAA